VEAANVLAGAGAPIGIGDIQCLEGRQGAFNPADPCRKVCIIQTARPESQTTATLKSAMPNAEDKVIVQPMAAGSIKTATDSGLPVRIMALRPRIFVHIVNILGYFNLACYEIHNLKAI
jgi:hypothetical protein